MIAFETYSIRHMQLWQYHQNSTHLIVYCNQNHLKIEFYRFFKLEKIDFTIACPHLSSENISRSEHQSENISRFDENYEFKLWRVITFDFSIQINGIETHTGSNCDVSVSTVENAFTSQAFTS